MASRSIGSIYAELALKDKNFSAGLKGAASEIKKFGGMAMGAGVAAAGALGTALIAGTKHTMTLTDDLVDLSTQTGLTIADTMKLQQAYKDGGKEAESLGRDIGRMQKSIVGAANGGNDPFKALGLSAKDLLAMNPAKQFELIAAAIMRVQNVAQRNTLLRDVFGKEGIGLVSVLPELKNAERILGRMPELADKYGKSIAEANDLMQHLPIKSEQFFMGFTAGIIGELLPNLRMIDNHDFTTLGENIGKAVSSGFVALTDGTLFEIITMEGYKAIVELSGKMITNAGRVFEFISAGLKAALEGTFEGQGTFMERLAHNIAGMSEANILQPEINAIQEAIDAAWADVGKKTRGGETGGKEPSTLPPIEIPLTEAKTPTITVKTPEKMDVNEYQRRGLSLDGGNNSIVSETRKQTEMMAKLTDSILRFINLNHAATW